MRIIIYTDVWASMGQEDQARKSPISALPGKSAAHEPGQKDAIVLHCLPAKRGKEITMK